MKLLRSSLRNTVVPAIWILVLMVSLGLFGDTEYTPSLPRIAHDLGVSYGAVQQSMTVYLLAFVGGSLLGIWLLKHISPVRILRVGLVLIVMGAMLPFSLVYALPVIFTIMGLLGIAVYWLGPLYALRLEREAE